MGNKDDKSHNVTIHDGIGQEFLISNGFQFEAAELQGICIALHKISTDNMLIGIAVESIRSIAEGYVSFADRAVWLDREVRNFDAQMHSIESLLTFSNSLVDDRFTDPFEHHSLEEIKNTKPVDPTYSDLRNNLELSRSYLMNAYAILERERNERLKIRVNLNTPQRTNSFNEYVSHLKDFVAHKWEVLGGEVNNKEDYKNYFWAIFDPLYLRADDRLTKKKNDWQHNIFRKHVEKIRRDRKGEK